MSSVVGEAPWSEAVDVSTGAGGIFGPPDQGFPDTGVIALGGTNAPGWVYGEVDLMDIAKVRANGTVLNRRDWDAQFGRADPVTVMTLT